MNAKRELGLSEGRIRNLKLFKNTILKYEAEVLNGKSIVIKDVNVRFADNFKKWLFDKNYSANYVGKNISNLRAVCTDAAKNEIEVSPQLNHIKFLSESKPPEDIVYLNEEELEAIRKVPLTRESLINARKWLLLGCLLGQRGSDLLSINAQNIKDINGIKIIELRQGKTGKIVAIPLLPEATEIIEHGMPYKISMVHFNEYIKEVCEAAKINTPIKGRQKLKNGVATIKDIFPKWKVVSSHVCRRSFATNFYGKIPTPILMSITGHGTENMFLKYIGKTSYDNAYQMLEYFSKIQN